MSTPPSAAGPVPDAASGRLVAADRWMLWQTLARGLAHGLANAAQMLALDPTPPRAREEAVERLHAAITRLGECHRPSPTGPTPVHEVLTTVQDMQRLQAAWPSTELTLDAEHGLPAVAMSAADLSHVLLALVTNAKQAVPDEQASIVLRARPAASGIEITIEDAGPGVPATLGERAFEAGVTSRPGAAGLGLAAARTLAERADGTLVLAPERSRFVLRLPVWMPAPRA